MGVTALVRLAKINLFILTYIFMLYAGGTSEIVHRPAADQYPQQRQPDITKAKKILRWQPIVIFLLHVYVLYNKY